MAAKQRKSPSPRIDLTPEDTTATGVRASSCRSAEMSKVFSAPLQAGENRNNFHLLGFNTTLRHGQVNAHLCTPPIPPVANTRMPAMEANIMVLATVVAAHKKEKHSHEIWLIQRKAIN